MYNQNQKTFLYKKGQVGSASPLQLVILLYERALDLLHLAKKELKNVDPQSKEKVHIHIIGAQDIVEQLVQALDERQSKEMTDQLLGLYVYVQENLVQADLKKDEEPLKKAMVVLENLLSAWKTVYQTQKGHFKSPNSSTKVDLST